MRNSRVLEYKIYRQRKRRRIYLRQKHWLANRPKGKTKRRKKKSFTWRPRKQNIIRLPYNFSFIQSPDDVLDVFARFAISAEEETDVILDFSHVQNITPDVIPLLIAKVYKYARQINISGTRPQRKGIDDLLLESGFYKMVGLTNYTSSNGLLDMHKNKVVDRGVAVQARIFTATKTFGIPNMFIRPLYRTLIECMANTKKHASDEQSKGENWWLSVYHNSETKITSFSFCDTGIGIFKSTRLEKITKLALRIGLKSNADILKKILEGKIASSTGLPYRGQGLPKIFADYKSGSLKKLYIAANDTFADFDNGTFVDLKNELNGTFLYWEISPN